MNYDLPWNTHHKLPNNKYQASLYQLPVADDSIINIKNQSTSCHHSSLNTHMGREMGLGGQRRTNSHLDLPFLCALTVSRKTSNSSSRSLGPAMFSGWNCTLITPRVWTECLLQNVSISTYSTQGLNRVFTSKCQHFCWHSDSTQGLNRAFASKSVNIFADNTQGLNRVLLQHLSTFLLATPRVFTSKL